MIQKCAGDFTFNESDPVRHQPKIQLITLRIDHKSALNCLLCF